MAASSSSSFTYLLKSLSSLSLPPSQTPPPTTSPTTVSLPSSSSSKTLKIKQPITIPVINEVSPDIQALLFPSLAYSNTLFFKSAYNVQVMVNPEEPEESLIGRFRREVFKANVIQECKRRRFFETNQEKRRRKIRDAAKRRARSRRPRPMAKKEENTEKKVVVDEDDNWEFFDGEVPYCQSL